MTFSIIITALALSFVSVMLWKCWNLPPRPLVRLWSIGYAALMLAWLVAHWNAQLWKTRYYQLERVRFESRQ